MINGHVDLCQHSNIASENKLAISYSLDVYCSASTLKAMIKKSTQKILALIFTIIY